MKLLFIHFCALSTAKGMKVNMNDYQQHLQEELRYLENTVNFLKSELARETQLLSDRKSKLRASRKDMWEDTAHFSGDFSRLTEINQYLVEVNSQTASYNNTLKVIDKYRSMIKSPYFGRFDFAEEDSEGGEKIYIGLHNVMDQNTHDIFVYDWRAPISSIFYRYELGEASYEAPSGTIRGNVLLKRQYKIQDSELKFFFDCSIRIDDEILQEVLSHNSSAKMRNIVETIQREQDMVIRDTENDLLIVQGVAGSGKTSIALHRIAYLLYHGLSSELSYKNMLIVSPNTIFSKYISGVLPELGEENVAQVIFDDFAADVLSQKGKLETRNSYLEYIAASKDNEEVYLKKQCYEFKGSKTFKEILDRLLLYCENHMISFEDVYYDGRMIETKQALKSLFLDNRINMPAVKRLKRIENIIVDKIHPLRKERLKKIEKLVRKMDGHDFEVKPYSRLLLLKESKALLRRVRKFTEIDYFQVYHTLFKEKGLLCELANDLELPGNIEDIVAFTGENLENQYISYEDSAALLYLKLKLEGSDMFSGIKHVVIDEAQDYSPVQYEVFKLLFKDAGYTVLGDINQSIDRELDFSLYDAIAELFNRRKALKIYLNRSYRSSFEISTFAQSILNKEQDIIPFERHESEPAIIPGDTPDDVVGDIVRDIRSYLEQGYGSIAVICKTALESEELYEKLKNLLNIKLISAGGGEMEKGVTVVPSYMSKGLEFDVVLVYNVSAKNYSTEFDRKLLYIACTRALHRLALYYAGEKSPFI